MLNIDVIFDVNIAKTSTNVEYYTNTPVIISHSVEILHNV